MPLPPTSNSDPQRVIRRDPAPRERSPSALDAPLGPILSVRSAGALAKAFGMSTVGDLLAHYPRRYARRGELTALDGLPLDENVTIVAEVLSATSRSMKARRGSIFEATITDGTAILTLTFFNQKWRDAELVPGARGIFAGKVGQYKGARQLTHPDYELFEPDSELASDPVAVSAWALQPVPIYPATAAVASWQVRDAIASVLDAVGPLEDPVPEDIRKSRRLLPFSRALELIHRPITDADWATARASLRFQEAFVLQAALLRQRARLRETAATPRAGGAILAGFDEALPFVLTSDQLRVGEEIANDLADSAPMNRLVQGEVGSGKTLVAMRAMLVVAESSGQSAFLAPTEVLAHQHLRSIVATLGPDLAARLRPTLITGQLGTAQRRKALLAAISGSARIVVGTHALLSDNVGFFDLALVVVDEQHRFGVEQRETLRLKGTTPPHVLVLTATPIPRTVAMTVFGDLDISTISELPSGRSPTTSHVVPLAEKPGWMPRVWARVAEEVERGHQAFVVCPAIDGATAETRRPPEAMATAPVQPAPEVPPASVMTVVAELRANAAMAGSRVEALHGKMSGDEKDRLMRSFAAGEIDVLVATTVIEVGVDVPNASAMVVLDADRFGVSQLHQLRGRVGRGSVPGLCLFVTSAEIGSLARERVEAVASTLDGFELANRDLELRQEGDVLGSVQSGGRSSLRLLRVTRDGEVIVDARSAASQLLEGDPSLEHHEPLAAALNRRLDASAEAFLGKN